jgi:hypothetical protein
VAVSDEITYGEDNLPKRKVEWTAIGPQYVTFDERLDADDRRDL